jgi:hypothetical protein
MESKINIAELLKDCPSGMELYSPIFGEVYLDKIIPHLAIRVTTDKKQGNFKEEFLYDGRYGMNGECMLFPSKDQRDWSKFHRHFQDGDICCIKTKEFEHIFIFKVSEDYNYIQKYANLSENHFYTNEDPVCPTDYVKEIRLATEEEKQKLFQAIKDNGYKWNAETKTLEKLVTIFKVGDRIKLKDTYAIAYAYAKKRGVLNTRKITKIEHSHYILDDKEAMLLSNQYLYELAPDKFDINTLVPFESRVLVRDADHYEWEGAIFGRYDGKNFFTIGGSDWGCCIPYEGNEHLLGKTNDCDEYYKIWE